MSSEKQISRLYRKDFLNVLISKPQPQQLTTNLNPFIPISMLKLKKERWLFALKYVGFQTSKIWLWIMRTSNCLSVQLAAVFHYKRGLLITDCAVLISMHPVSQLSQVTALPFRHYAIFMQQLLRNIFLLTTTKKNFSKLCGERSLRVKGLSLVYFLLRFEFLTILWGLLNLLILKVYLWTTSIK